MLSRLLLFFALLTFSFVLPAQDTQADAASDPVTAIKNLRSGTLIIRLPSNRRKITALRDALENDQNNVQRQKWLEKELQATHEQTQTFNNNMYRAFQESYDFSDIRYTYDYFTPELKAGQFTGHFLNADLEPDEGISLGKKPVFILSFGRTNKDFSDGVEAMVVLGEQLKSPPPPFPYYQRLNDFQAFWGNLFPRDDQNEWDALRLVGKLNGKLYKFYNRNVSATDF
ncbi:MAG: hypothetical protein RIC19_08220 [Phaeodactylibacter sp.]|uniref:hypothetical protein n=1 Tax=Phaeodactylibacter sp. TaxID=1940289 RepID=UPI0032ED7D16